MGRRASSRRRSRQRKRSNAAEFRGSIAAQFSPCVLMMPRRFFAAAVLACLSSFAAAAASNGASDKLTVTTIVIDSTHGPVKFQAEVAADPASQEKGDQKSTRLNSR